MSFKHLRIPKCLKQIIEPIINTKFLDCTYSLISVMGIEDTNALNNIQKAIESKYI